MSWLTNFVLPKIRAVVAKKEVPDNLWDKCPKCEQMLFHRELEQNLFVCHNCGHHMRLDPRRRMAMLFDGGEHTVARPGRHLLLPGSEALSTPYGRLLCAKLVLFALLMLLAALNRQRFTPAMARGAGGAALAFRRSVLLEWYLIVAALAVTAAMTGLYSPGHH